MKKRISKPQKWFGPDARASLIPLITLAMLTVLFLRLASDTESSIALRPGALARAGLDQAADNQLDELPTMEQIGAKLAPPKVTLEDVHNQNSEGFARAEGFGRHRGGAHILLDNGEVRFIMDSSASIQGIDPSDRAENQSSAYGLWGSLGVRTSAVDHSTLDEMYEGFIDRSWLVLWNLEKIQLISLNRFETPVAYVDSKLPSMNQLKNSSIPTRDLNQFEAGAVTRIIDGEKIVTQEEMSSIKMMGAISATRQCIECHDTQVGALLGAFSYEFTPKDIN